MISPKFQTNKKAVALISSIIAQISCSKVSILQIALGILVDKKKVIEHLHEYGVTSTYNEVRQFKISAAAHASNENLSMLKNSDGLVQGVSDNFDANISSQNCIKQTHSLATIVLQHQQNNSEINREIIPRLKQSELAKVKLEEPEIKFYKGEKKPAMPAKFALPAPPKPEFLHIQKQTVQRSQTIDFGFLKEILTKESVPDFSGYNTMLRRNSGNTLKPKTNILYRPLINKIPSDPSTILTAMCDIEAV